MLTAQEIRDGIEKIKAEYADLPERSAFGTRNWEIRDATVAALEWAAAEAEAGRLTQRAIEREADRRRDEAQDEDGEECCEHPEWRAADALEWITGDADPPFGD